MIDLQERANDSFGGVAVGASIAGSGCDPLALLAGDAITGHSTPGSDDRDELFRVRHVISALLQQNNRLCAHELGFSIKSDQRLFFFTFDG